MQYGGRAPGGAQFGGGFPGQPGGAPGAPQGYGAPQGFGAPQQFGAPQSFPGAPGAPQGYGAPQGFPGAHGAPQGYGAPQGFPGAGGAPTGFPGAGGAPQGYGAPPQGFGAPQGFPGAPQTFGAPQGFPGAAGGFPGAPAGFGAPPQSFGAPPGRGFAPPAAAPAATSNLPLNKPPASPWEINPHNPKVFLDIAFNGQCRRVVIELFADAVPKTAENFRSICTGERGIGSEGYPLHYKGSYFHRVIKNFVSQGGDITVGDGTGGESIFIGSKFPDESFQGKAGTHWGLGTMSMANAGPNTNRSQFSMCVDGVAHLDGVHVVFGQVIHGLDWLVQMNSVPVDAGDKPISPVQITNCGMYTG